MDRERDIEIEERETVQIDVEKYQKYLEDTDLSDEEKRQFLETLWSILVAFIDLGFGVGPVQSACGKLVEEHGILTLSEQDALDCDRSPTTTKKRSAVSRKKGSAAEGVRS